MGGAHFIYRRVHMSRNCVSLRFILCLSDVQLIKVVNRRPGSSRLAQIANIMREQNSINKSVFSAVTAFFLCRPVHYPGALAGGRKTQENELNRSAARLALAGNYPGARWIVPAGVPGGACKRLAPAGWLASGIPGGACNRDRHPAPRKGVFYTIIGAATARALYAQIYYYRQTFTIFPIYTKFLLPGRYFAPRYHFF